MAMRKQTLDELEPFFAACKVLKINPEKWLSDVLDRCFLVSMLFGVLYYRTVTIKCCSCFF